MRARFDSAYIRSELERISEQLDAPLTVFLIGGGAMAFRDLKNTTKDIDLVVASGADLGQLQATLLERGYEIVRAPDEEYEVSTKTSVRSLSKRSAIASRRSTRYSGDWKWTRRGSSPALIPCASFAHRPITVSHGCT